MFYFNKLCFCLMFPFKTSVKEFPPASLFHPLTPSNGAIKPQIDVNVYFSLFSIYFALAYSKPTIDCITCYY